MTRRNSRILVAHDHRFPVDELGVWTNGNFGDFSQYTSAAEHVTFYARKVARNEQHRSYARVANRSIDFQLRGSLRQLVTGALGSKLGRTMAQSDAIVVRLPSFTGSAVGLRAITRGRALNVELVGCPWDAFRTHSRRGVLLAPLMWAMTRLLVWRASRVLYVTDSFLQRRYPTRGLAFAASNVHVHRRPDLARRVRERLATFCGPRDEVKLVTVADVGLGYKGQAFVIESLRLLDRVGVRAEYHLVGGGDPTALQDVARRSKVLDRVHFHGRLPHSEVAEVLAEMDVYVQPSLTEGLPRALAEAMALGLPAIASRVGGMREMLPDENLFVARSATAVARGVQELVGRGLAAEGAQNELRADRFEPDRLSSIRAEFYGGCVAHG